MSAEDTGIPVKAPGHWDTDDGGLLAYAYAERTRTHLLMGDRSDFALANDQYLASRDDPSLIVYQTAAKERIRWLSVRLAIAEAALASSGLVDALKLCVQKMEGDWETTREVEIARAALAKAGVET